MELICEVAGELARLPDRATFLAVASQLLVAMVPGDLVGWNKVTRAGSGSEVVAYPDDAFGNRVHADQLAAASADHPLILNYLAEPPRAGLPDPRRLSDVSSLRELHRTTAYEVLLRPMGVERMLSIMTARMDADSASGWAVTRERRDFTDAQVALAGRLQPTLSLLDAAHAPSSTLPSWTESADTDWAQAYGLSARQAEVLNLVARGLTANAVGHLLGISPRTVSKHLQHAYARLGCDNRVSALAILSGWGPGGPAPGVHP